MLYIVRDFVKANIFKSIYYALFESHINYAFIIWSKTLAQLTASTFSIKRNLKLSILKSVMLTPFPRLIALKLSKLQIKSRSRSAS